MTVVLANKYYYRHQKANRDRGDQSKERLERRSRERVGTAGFKYSGRNDLPSELKNSNIIRHGFKSCLNSWLFERHKHFLMLLCCDQLCRLLVWK